MGNDGGSIPKRRELVKEAARLPTAAEIKESQQEQQEYHWTTCPLSHEPLKQPVVSDSAGILYNKDAILEFLLPQGDGTPERSKADKEEVLGGRVRSLKDVVEVKFEVEEDEAGKDDGKTSSKKLKWICPITNKVLGPGVRSVYLIPCGHAFLESTVTEIQGEACLQCNEPYTPENVVIILPTLSADKEKLLARAQKLKEQGLTHSLKKVTGSGKKRKKNGDIVKAETTEESPSISVTETTKLAGASRNSSSITTSISRIQNAATASLTAKVLAEEEAKAKRRRLDSNENLKSLFSSGKANLAKFYKSQDSFTCLSNPSIKLPSSNVNDDYCDCPDGSDEPGTSACSYISPLSPPTPENYALGKFNVTPALPGFYCKNKGHQPSYIPFLSVNDGVCDYDLCCDGSDEWAQVGGVSCPDRCKEIGKEWKKQNELRQKSMSNAARKRKELVTEARRLRKEVEDQIGSLGIKVEASEVKVKALEEQLAEVERKERGKVVKAPEKGGKMSVLANLAKDRIEELREFLVDVRSQRDQGRERIKELETILTTFKEEYNPNFNDEGVKRAVRSWEEYTARDKPDDTDAAHERDLDEVSKADSETGNINWDDWQDTNASDVDLLYKFEEYLPMSLRGWLDQKLRDLRVLLIENGIIAPSSASDSESKVVTDARNALKSAQDDLEKNKKQLSTHQSDLEKDYGIDDVFRALKGQCVSTDSGEYTYELCWLDRTKQKSKKSGGDTNLGNFVRIESITVDDDLPPDGKGIGSGERVAMKHENGQHCWNGPNRSTTIVLACAEKDEIWKIVEEEKCVYRMEVGTPAVCDGAEGVGKGIAKDEL
ncbi:hypothetical protein MMC11_006210 [Xylographa trunciseda]|nr:hypothetical protein [Xylographa trunciseda]